MPDIERAFERLYATPDLADELVDDDAQILMQWGEAQIDRLANRASDDDSFEMQNNALHDLMIKVNRFVGRREQLDRDQQLTKLGEISAMAREIGYQLEAMALLTYQQQTAADTQATMLESLLAHMPPDAD